MKKILMTLMMLCVAGCAPATKTLKFDQARNVYYLNGDMDSNSYQEIEETLSRHAHEPVTIMARSNGGKLAGLEGAMDAIRAHGRVHWVVPHYAYCYSACAVLGLSSAKIDGTLYFHSIFSSYKSTTFQLMGRNESVIKRLTSYGYDKNMVEHLFDSVNIYKKLQFNDGVLQP